MTGMQLVSVASWEAVKGVPFATGVKYRQCLVVGPPGSAKSTLIKRIGGWPEEGYIDLAIKRWWTSQSLSLRPREVHFGLPFVGHKQSLAVFDKAFVDAEPPLQLETERIFIPPREKHFLSVDWRTRFAFEFLLPDPADLYVRRVARAEAGTHAGDRDLKLSTVTRQIEVYERVAMLFHRNGMTVYVRRNVDDPPLRIADEN